MPNNYFRFKQFTVMHDRCAMKVGTDGVLLGAWTDVNHAIRIMDVGTGSGLIALMLAQRNVNAVIDTVEIDADAACQANENFSHSPFVNINPCKESSFQQFAAETTSKYDLIVSNPPFFHRSLKSPDDKRSAARHTDSLLIEDFIALSAQLLSNDGRISFIFPASDKDYLIQTAKENNLHLARLTTVYPTSGSEPKRVLMELSKHEAETSYSDLIIENARHVYSEEFTRLVKDFYLKL